MTASEVAQAAMDRLKITVEAVFVPWSKSRNAVARPALTVKRDGRDVLTTDYSSGIGHCPAYKNAVGLKSSIHNTEAIAWECEHGREGKRRAGNAFVPLLPDPCDVLYALVTDADVLNYAGFEDWASSFGYDADSRKAEATYNTCMRLALQMRAGIGDAGLSELAEAFREY